MVILTSFVVKDSIIALYLPEEEDETVCKSSKVVVSTDLCSRIQLNVTKYLF
jgi:hypothetical protein